MIFNGKNLGERHRDLNLKVTEAAAKQINFEELKSHPEKGDVDNLYRIDLASEYKNIDYILEVLKCGDVFHITRALKCLWLYADDFSQYMNTDYLETNIFPHMSMKMQRKMLTSISIHMRNRERAIHFYKYCINAKLNVFAYKFLVFTPDSFKLYVIKRNDFYNFNYSKFFKQFIGHSFELALAYLASCNSSSYIIYVLRFLYSVSQVEYLNIMERYICIEARYPHCSQRLGSRISKDILIKYKQRVLNSPLLYVNILSKSMLLKYLTETDVEILGIGLMPKSSEDFWSLDFYNSYKFILEKIPANKLFVYLKHIYQSKYKEDDTFEMTIEFYKLKYYEMLNIAEREAWALQHIERDEDLPGIKNYMWYKFVSFSKAFPGIKRYIFLTPDKYERSLIVNILPETARNQDDLIKILCYYYKRHVNESETHKESLINKIIQHHDIYSFNDECWTLFDKLLYSLDVYTTGSFKRLHYKFRSLVYHILHDQELPEAMKEIVDYLRDFYRVESLIEELSEERKIIVTRYLLSYFDEKIKSLMAEPDYNTTKEDQKFWGFGSIKDKIHDVVWKIWNILHSFNRPHEDCPETAVHYMESNMDSYERHEMYRTKFIKKSEEDFVRWLKQDVQMAVDGINEIRCNTYRWNFRLCRLFRKLKVYFPHDVGKKYLNYFMEYLSDIPKSRREYRNIKMAVVGVFYLADAESVIHFLENNIPASPKIDHRNIDNRLLQVQKAICRLAYHPRPPLPLSNIQKYITGDYVHYCIPMFYNYFANLPSNEKFIETLLDAPLSIQKHGLRLAFKAYDAETLKPIIKSAWKKTKNVSLRMILYETLFDRILNENEEVQKELYDVLKLYTSELNHDDHEYVYSLLVSDGLPDMFKGDFIETAWFTVSKLSDKSVDIRRRTSVISHMEGYLHLVQRDFPRVQIIDEHINNMLCERNINRESDEDCLKELIKAKWHLTAKYIVSFSNEVEQRQSLRLLQTIMTETIESWSLINHKIFTLRKFMQKLIETIMSKDPKTIESCATIVTLYQCIRDNLQSFLKKEEIYYIIWELKLSIISRNIIHKRSKKEDTYRYMSSNQIGRAYGKVVAKILMCCVKNNEFYCSYYQSIADIVNNIGSTICDILGEDSCGFVYDVCDSLINIKTTETHLLALFMLPRDPDWYWESEHNEILVNISKQFVSQEVRCFFYEKYVLSDYKVRKYVS